MDEGAALDADRAVPLLVVPHVAGEHVGVRVSAALELLEARGAPVRERPEIVFGDATYDLWLAFVTDPDGNQILLHQRKDGSFG